MRDVLAKGEESLPQGDWRRYEIQNRMADAIAAVARFEQTLSTKIRAAKTAEAEALFRKSAASLSGSSAVESRYRTDCFKRLVRFCESSRRNEEAAKWRAKLAEPEIIVEAIVAHDASSVSEYPF
jgi:hypothetical protein